MQVTLDTAQIPNWSAQVRECVSYATGYEEYEISQVYQRGWMVAGVELRLVPVVPRIARFGYPAGREFIHHKTSEFIFYKTTDEDPLRGLWFY